MLLSFVDVINPVFSNCSFLAVSTFAVFVSSLSTAVSPLVVDCSFVIGCKVLIRYSFLPLAVLIEATVMASSSFASLMIFGKLSFSAGLK